jgi:glycosyltransferase involved in cell wall biosynthesis
MQPVNNSKQPAVSIILPTYNRARFLPGAFASICSQSFQDWELIVVDDGSTDNTRDLVSDALRSVCQRTQYIAQPNQGPVSARKTGLKNAMAKHIAFFDSDDIWLPHHLQDCVVALQAHPEVDWVFGSCRVLDHSTESVLTPSTFYEAGKPRPFLKLRTRTAGQLRIIDDPKTLCCAILHGLGAGLQNSVIRRDVLGLFLDISDKAIVGEDQILLIRAISSGYRFAYLDQVHVDYKVHAGNSSAAANNSPLEKHIAIRETVIGGLEELRRSIALNRSQRRALDRRLSQEYFWKLGYSLLWQNGRRAEALRVFQRGLALYPWDVYFWKTYLLAMGRSFLAAPAQSRT